MRVKMMKKSIRFGMIIMVIGLMVCAFSLSVFSASVVPVLFDSWQSGNAKAECELAGCNAEFFLKIDGWDKENGKDGTYDYVSDPDALENEWPIHDNIITITNSAGQTFDWASVYPVTCIIVKGGPGANVFYYPGGAYSDTSLYAPTNLNNQLYDISHVTFCFNEPKQECEWIGETAWAAGTRYTPRGNWATYTPYVANSTVTLYAGRTMEAGTVNFSASIVGQVTITINLNSGWRFEDVAENVKIQGYTSAPSGNPVPGRFAYKGNASESSFSMAVPVNNFYGIHANVEWAKCE